MFSFLLSFIIDLYNFILLTPNTIIAGMNIIFCSNVVVSMNTIPFIFPSDIMHADIVYPRQNPLNSIIPNTIGIPIIVVPANHSNTVNIISDFISFDISIK